jgi:hypothetical protein
MTKERLQKEYWAAIAEYDFLTNYLNASNALTKPEREFLEEFVNLAKRKSDRLRKVVPTAPPIVSLCPLCPTVRSVRS